VRGALTIVPAPVSEAPVAAVLPPELTDVERQRAAELEANRPERARLILLGMITPRRLWEDR
jgi:hypothetical protein